jgi:hypothetical protein
MPANKASALLNQLVPAFDAAFPNRIRGYYVHGSYSDDSAVATSDLDLIVLFKDAFAEGEKARTESLASEWVTNSPIELDLEITDEATLFASADPAFKLGSRLVAGEDVRDRMPLMPIADWASDRMHTSYWKLVKLFERPPVVRLPLGYPAPEDRFRGYCNRLMRLDDGSEVPGTRDLIRLVGWIGTALVASQAGKYVVRKSDCHPTYQCAIGDEWGTLLEAVYVNCKTRWQYKIPESEADRQLLASLCERTLAFENHFLRLYRDFVVKELRSGNPATTGKIKWLMGQISFEDDEIVRAVSEA